MSGPRIRAVAIAVLAAAGLAAPLVWSHPFVLHIAIQALIWALFAASWDLLSGYTGQVSFGHAGFFSIGAYTSACLTKLAGLSSWLGMAAALLLCALVGLCVGFPALRLRGHYLALVTLGFGEIVQLIATVEALSVLVVPSEWQNAIAFGTMILVLLVRPNGLFGKKQP